MRTGLDALTGHAGESLPASLIQRVESLAVAIADGQQVMKDVADSGVAVDLVDLSEAAAMLGMKGKDCRSNAERRLRTGTKEDGHQTTYPALRSSKGDLVYDPTQSPFATDAVQPTRRATQVDFPPVNDERFKLA